MLKFHIFFDKYKSVIFHFVIFSIIILASILPLWKISKLDLFDFFSVIFKITNLYIVLAIMLIIIAIIMLFSGLKKLRHDQKKMYREVQRIKETEQKNFEIAEENRKMLIEKMELFTEKLHNLAGTVNRINYNITVKVLNHISLEEKLNVGLRTINFDRIEVPDAVFVAFFEKIISKIAGYVRTIKQDNTRFDYKTQKKFKHEIMQLLLSEDININKKTFSDLLNALIIDFIEEKRINKSTDVMDIISDKFKTLVEAIYFEYIEFYKPKGKKEKKITTIDLIEKYKDKLILADDPKEIVRINHEISRLEDI